MGATIPAQSIVYWPGPTGDSTDHKDLDETPKNVHRIVPMAACNLAELAQLLKGSPPGKRTYHAGVGPTPLLDDAPDRRGLPWRQLMIVGVLRVRFDTNSDPSSVWSDDLTMNWLQPLRQWSLANYWSLSTYGHLTVEPRVYAPVVMADPRISGQSNDELRNALIGAAVRAGSDQARVDWSDIDILLLLFAQPTDLFGGASATVPDPGGARSIPVTVCDVASPFVDCCQELGHSFGFDHELDPAGMDYRSPYSCMSSRVSTLTFIRDAEPSLPDGLTYTTRDDRVALDHPAQRDVGALVAGAQLLRLPGFGDTPLVRQLGQSEVRASPTVRIYARNYVSALPQTPNVLVTFPSPLLDGRVYTVELRRGGGYDTGVTGAAAGLVVHSTNPDGRVRYDGVAPLSLAESQTDWAYSRGGFALRYGFVHPAHEFVDVQVLPRAVRSFPLRGVLLLGGFRTQHELVSMSHDDMRNTVIVELEGRTAQRGGQAMDNESLAGAGALLVAMRRLQIRDDASLRTMTADDMRNTLIVELDATTGAGLRLQGFGNLELVQILWGSDLPWRGIDLTAIAHWTRGVLLVGGFRTQHELNTMSFEDMRNTLIVELDGRTAEHDYQAFDDRRLAGAGAALVALREIRARDDAALRTMTADDMRNTLIVELGAQTDLGLTLQGLSDLDLGMALLGVEKDV